MPGNPWILSGIITDIDGSTGLEDVTVKAVNLRSLEVLTTTTESDGSYSITLTSYEDNDGLYIEAKKNISDSMVKFGNAYEDVDTGEVGKNVNITLDKKVDLKVETVILRTPYQDKEDRIFVPEFNANRVMIAGHNKIQTTIARDSDELVTSIEEDDGVHTKVITLTRDSDNFVTGIAERFK